MASGVQGITGGPLKVIALRCARTGALATVTYALAQAGCSPTPESKQAGRPPPREHVDPALDVGLAGSDNEYVISWRKCGGQALGFPLHALHVRRLQTADVNADLAETACALEHERGHEGPTVDSWTYGTPLAGLKLNDCEPLQRGQAYLITILNGLIGGERYWIQSNGDITHLGGMYDIVDR